MTDEKTRSELTEILMIELIRVLTLNGCMRITKMWHSKKPPESMEERILMVNAAFMTDLEKDLGATPCPKNVESERIALGVIATGIISALATAKMLGVDSAPLMRRILDLAQEMEASKRFSTVAQ